MSATRYAVDSSFFQSIHFYLNVYLKNELIIISSRQPVALPF